MVATQHAGICYLSSEFEDVTSASWKLFSPVTTEVGARRNTGVELSLITSDLGFKMTSIKDLPFGIYMWHKTMIFQNMFQEILVNTNAKQSAFPKYFSLINHTSRELESDMFCTIYYCRYHCIHSLSWIHHTFLFSFIHFPFAFPGMSYSGNRLRSTQTSQTTATDSSTSWWNPSQS